MEVIIQIVAAFAIVAFLVLGRLRHRRRTRDEVARVIALGERVDASAISALHAASNYANAAVRTAASRGLANVHAQLVTRGRSDIAPLLSLLKEQEAVVQCDAVKALQEAGNPESAAPLASLLVTTSGSLRQLATEALASLGLGAKSSLLPLLADANESVRDRAALLLMRIGVPESDPVLADYRDRKAAQNRKEEEKRKHACSICDGYAEKPRVISSDDMRLASRSGYTPSRRPSYMVASHFSTDVLIGRKDWSLCEPCASEFEARVGYLLKPTNCDFCGIVIHIYDSDIIPLQDMKRAVNRGFDPRRTAINLSAIERMNQLTGLSSDEWFQTWRQDVLIDDTDWFVCKLCMIEFRHARQ